MNIPEQVTIATANTYFGHTTRIDDGLAPIARVDILLLQEVFNPTVDQLPQKLTEAGFKLVRATGRYGLVIALRSDSAVSFVEGSVREHTLAPIGILEKQLARRFAKQKHEFTQRGLLAAKFKTHRGATFTVATTHPAVAVTPRRRAAQIDKIASELENPYYGGKLILTGDMNHYPDAKPVDKALWRKANLTLVDLNGESTYSVRGSKQEKYFRIAAALQRRPIESYDGQLDDVLYRGEGIESISTTVTDIQSDHRSVVVTFSIG